MSMDLVHPNKMQTLLLPPESEEEELERLLKRVPCCFDEGFDGSPSVSARVIHQTPFAATRIIKVTCESWGEVHEITQLVAINTIGQKRAVYMRDGLERWEILARVDRGTDEFFFRGYDPKADLALQNPRLLNHLRTMNHDHAVACIAESSLSENLLSPLVKIVLGYLKVREPLAPLEEQESAYRMEHVRTEILRTFVIRNHQTCGRTTREGLRARFLTRGLPVLSINLDKIAEITARFLDGTGIDPENTSPEDMARAADLGIELPVHLRVLDVNARNDQGKNAMQCVTSLAGARALFSAGANPADLDPRLVPAPEQPQLEEPAREIPKALVVREAPQPQPIKPATFWERLSSGWHQLGRLLS